MKYSNTSLKSYFVTKSEFHILYNYTNYGSNQLAEEIDLEKKQKITHFV